MPKQSSIFSRFWMQMVLSILGISLVFFAMSSFLFTSTYSGSSVNSLRETARQAGRLLKGYARGDMTKDALKEAVNPSLTIDGGFYMLLDKDQTVLAYTEAAAPYFAGETVQKLLRELQSRPSSFLESVDGPVRLQLLGEKTEDGYVLVGRPNRVFRGAAVTFRNRMLFSMAAVTLVVLVASLFLTARMSKPARLITHMADRITRGEIITVPENLPGKEMQKLAAALNHMSSAVAKAIQDLQNEKDTMALILEGLNEGILAVDSAGGILHENEAAWRLLGGADSPAYQAVMAALREDKPEDAWQSRWFGPDRVLLFAVSRLPAKQDGGRQGTVALIRDVTEEERLERTRHDYVANISHELRTPLSSIRGLGEGLRDGMVTEDADRIRYYTIIVDEANRLSRLVNDLLELSSLQSNPAAFDMEQVDPNELIYDLFDRNQSLFTEKRLSFSLSLPEEPLPDIRSNEDRLSQALTIFLDNARKYTPAGGSVTVGAEAAAGGTRLFVRDNGIGMDAETQALAFERFHQAERGRSDKGSGLGLAIAREVLQKMGITIQLKSAPGEGSEFSFTVPAGKPAAQK